MAGKQIMFYLKSKELIEILSILKKDLEIEIIKAGISDVPKIKKLDIENADQYFQQVPTGDWNQNNKCLIVSKGENIIIREIKQRNGTMRYSVDQMKNPESLILFVGGEYKDNVLIAGKIGYLTEGCFTKLAFNAFKKIITSISKKREGWYLSKDLNQSCRLTTNVNSSEEYDLKITD